MKLNLLPTHVSKAGQARSALLLSFLLMAGLVGASVWMITSSKKELNELKTQAAELKPKADQAVAISKQADDIIKQAGGIILNQKLAESMLGHNTVYPDLYDEVLKYIPSYYRVTSVSAVPASAQGCTLNITGVLQNYQQYADLMLAMLRIPNALAVNRQGYQHNDFYVPALTSDSQSGRPIELGAAPIPDNPQDRLRYYESQGRLDGFLGVGGFGSTQQPVVRGAMPKWSQVTISVAMARDLQTPDPKGTLSQAAAASGVTPPVPGGGNTSPTNNAAPRPGGPGNRGADDI